MSDKIAARLAILISVLVIILDLCMLYSMQH